MRGDETTNNTTFEEMSQFHILSVVRTVQFVRKQLFPQQSVKTTIVFQKRLVLATIKYFVNNLILPFLFVYAWAFKMTGIDKCQRKLLFPPRFVPYLEKHRIFELFHELTELLVQERPKDHVKYIKDILPCAAKRRDKPRIVFLAPSTFGIN